MTTKLPLSEANLPHVIEFFSEATAVGKTLCAWRTRYHYELAGIKTVMVRIESRGIEKKLHPGDVFIASESFDQAHRKAGGVVGVLQPYFAAIADAAKNKTAVICDWAGGLARRHAEILISSQFDERLAELKATGISFGVTTNAADRMQHALDNLLETKRAAPGLHRGVILNARLGDFDFVKGSYSASVFNKLLKAAVEDGGVVLRLPSITGDSWQTCESHGLTMPAVLKSKAPELAARTHNDTFVAQACISEMAAFWSVTDKEFSRVARFRDAPGQ